MHFVATLIGIAAEILPPPAEVGEVGVQVMPIVEDATIMYRKKAPRGPYSGALKAPEIALFP